MARADHPSGSNDHPRRGAVVTKGSQGTFRDHSWPTRQLEPGEPDRNPAWTLIARMIDQGEGWSKRFDPQLLLRIETAPRGALAELQLRRPRTTLARREIDAPVETLAGLRDVPFTTKDDLRATSRHPTAADRTIPEHPGSDSASAIRSSSRSRPTSGHPIACPYPNVATGAWSAPVSSKCQDEPPMVATAGDEAAPLLGRVDEVKLLASLLDEVATRGQALVFRGAPGIGKSRLLSEAARGAHERGMAVLTATGVQSEAKLPFAGLHQLLRPVRLRAGELPQIQRDALDAAFGLTRDVAPEPYRIAMAALDLVSEVAADGPLLLVVDDAQWLDRPTAEVLAFIARRIESDPVLLLAAARDGYPAGLTDAGLPEHRLTGLDDATAATLVDIAAPGLALTTRNSVLSEAAGNPLALLELPAAGGEQSPSGGMPLTERLERAFAGRVADLPDRTRLVLLVCALSDEDSVGEILQVASAVAGTSLDLEALEPAVDAALIDLDVNAIRFRHPLIRSAVRQSAGVQQRRRVHEALAEAFDAHPDRRVWHRAALMSGTHEALARELEEAGVRARRRGAVDVALTALRRAVQLSDPSHRAGRMLATAELAYDSGRPDIALAMLREIEHLDHLEPLDVARARFITELLDARALADRSRVADLIAIAEEAGAAGDRDLHHNLLWIASARTWWASPSADIRRLIVDAANRAGAPTAADARLVSIHAYADPYGNAPKIVDCLRDAADDPAIGAVPAGYLASAGMVIGAFVYSLTFCTAAIASAREEGRLGALPRLLATQAILAVRLPDWDIAIPAAEEARRLATELGQPIWLATAETAVAMVAALRGEPEATERATAGAEAIALPLGATHLVALAQSGPMLSALAGGRHAEALRLAERLFDPHDSAYHLHFACMVIGDLAEAAVLTEGAQAARERLSEVEAMVGGSPAEWVAISLRHARALLADDEREADARFEEALGADLDRWPLWRGRLLLAHGRWLRRHRRMTDSRAPLREARRLFDGIGAAGWGDQARRELRASGERSRRRVPEARDELTAQELQIAQLAAEGLSNREIGQRLFLSHRTVSTHLYRVFPKLGITSRAELSAALASP
jgi:DNA-binding CsgD family transcriptional regulator